MHVAPLATLACPLDGTALAGSPTLRCERGHAFDRAREGYWNLLVVQHKASRNPGDGKEMVTARRRVHKAGLYRPVADRLVELVLPLATEKAASLEGAPLRVVDAGCGEGYYLARLAAGAIEPEGAGSLEIAGTDVSKPAVQAAARRKGDGAAAITWAVANNRHLPFPPGGVDLVLSMFGFAVWPGFKAVQGEGGRVLLVDPGPEHLIELRRIIYPEVRRGAPPTLGAAYEAGYRIESEEPLRFSAEIPSQALVQDVIAMTPHASRMNAAGREALAKVERITVTMDVVFRMLRLAGEAVGAAEREARI